MNKRHQKPAELPVPSPAAPEWSLPRRTGVKLAQHPAAAEPELQRQAELFNEGIRLFHAQQFQAAKECFDKAARGPLADMAHSARMRSLMCQRRLASEPVFHDPDDCYAYAVTLMNQRRWCQAEVHLERALAQMPAADHLYYALALCRAWRGDAEAACNYLRRAIELQPRNLVAARNDPDFAPVSGRPPLSELLNSEPASR